MLLHSVIYYLCMTSHSACHGSGPCPDLCAISTFLFPYTLTGLEYIESLEHYLRRLLLFFFTRRTKKLSSPIDICLMKDISDKKQHAFSFSNNKGDRERQGEWPSVIKHHVVLATLTSVGSCTCSMFFFCLVESAPIIYICPFIKQRCSFVKFNSAQYSEHVKLSPAII